MPVPLFSKPNQRLWQNKLNRMKKRSLHRKHKPRFLLHR
nr:MAG TPA: hypothetical protein [Caudoviricetes sp.]